VALQHLPGGILAVAKRDQEVLGRDVVVLEGRRFLHRRLEHRVEPGRDVRRRSLGVRQGAEDLVDFLQDRTRAGAHFGQHGRDHPRLLGRERLKEVLGRDFGVVAPFRRGLGGGDSLLGLHGELIHAH
jgi:hypothetical protein